VAESLPAAPPPSTALMALREAVEKVIHEHAREGLPL
jgi:hypothetical protein